MLVPNAKYTFQVAAINGAGNGAYSEDRTVYTDFGGMLWIRLVNVQ